MKLIEKIARRLGYVQKHAARRYARAYAAANTNRLTFDWATGTSAADRDIYDALSTVRTRARNLAQNNDYAKKFLNLCMENIAGPDGFTLQMKVKEASGGFDTGANDMIEAAWRKWTKATNCDVAGRLTLRQIQKLLVVQAARDGEFLVRIVRRKGDPLHLQVLEPDILDEDYNESLKPNGFIRMGVEMDNWRRPIAYHIMEGDPAMDIYYWRQYARKYGRIPASDMLHGYIYERPNQSRGMSWMAASMTRLKHLTGYEDSAVINARISAAKMGFIQSNPEAASIEYSGQDEDSSGNQTMEIEPGTFEQLPPGMTFNPWEPKYPDAQHEMFVQAILRGISAGLLVSYSSLANDLSDVNYSSIRAGLVEEREVWRDFQGWFVDAFLNRIFEEWLEWAILTGELKLPMRKFDKFNVPGWIGRRWTWVDPEKDVNAEKDSIAAGFKSPRRVLAEKGLDIDEVYREIAEDQKLAKKYGISLYFGVTASSPVQTVGGDSKLPGDDGDDDRHIAPDDKNKGNGKAIKVEATN